MTLILNIATHGYALQVSDRLVTREQPGDVFEAFDVFANKTVIFGTCDGLVAIGYTGPAHIRGIPTDTWLAQTLADRPVRSDGWMFFGRVPAVRDLGFCLRRLRDRLAAEPHFVRNGGEVSAVGWQWPRKSWDWPSHRSDRVRPVIWLIRNRDRKSLTLKQIFSRYPARNEGMFFAMGASTALAPKEREDMIRKTWEAGLDIDQIENVLATAVRTAARQSGAIGPHCLVTLVKPWSEPHIRTRWLPDHPVVGDVNEGEPLPIGFQPWVVTDYAFVPPQLLVGAYELGTGRFLMELHGAIASDDQRLKLAVHPQAPTSPDQQPNMQVAERIQDTDDRPDPSDLFPPRERE